MKIYSLISILFLLLISGCAGNNITGGATAIYADEKMSNKIVTLETDKGIIKFELFEDKAPVTTKNFIELAESGFYDGLTFHRVEAGFVVQGGDPKGDGTGGSEKSISLEIHPDLKHVKGAVAMARKPDPNSATSQFYITLADTPFLDGDYAVFGKVLEGMDTVESIAVGDKMNKVSVE